jgi:hypothetical protein
VDDGDEQSRNETSWFNENDNEGVPQLDGYIVHEPQWHNGAKLVADCSPRSFCKGVYS